MSSSLTRKRKLAPSRRARMRYVAISTCLVWFIFFVEVLHVWYPCMCFGINVE